MMLTRGRLLAGAAAVGATAGMLRERSLVRAATPSSDGLRVETIAPGVFALQGL
jgi:hypothetical protein